MPKKGSPPEILATELVAQSRLFQIESVHLRFSNGEERDFERIRGWVSGSVMVVPMLDDETVLLVREYGVGIEQYFLGFPKGAISPNEEVLVTAQRELQEEIGYAAHDLVTAMRFSVSPAYQTTSVSLVIARDLYPSRKEGDEPEPLECVPWPLNQVDLLIKDPHFIEARSLLALLWVEREWRAKHS